MAREKDNNEGKEQNQEKRKHEMMMWTGTGIKENDKYRKSKVNKKKFMSRL